MGSLPFGPTEPARYSALTSTEFVLTANRRSLTPPTGLKGVIAQRRGTGGARREISAQIVLRSGDLEYEGWALNISRGGIRVLIEGHVSLGEDYQVLGYNPEDPDAPPRPARVVWMQDERDGAVLGMEFLDEPAGSTAPGAPSSPPAQASTPPGAAPSTGASSAPSVAPPEPPSEPPAKP